MKTPAAKHILIAPLDWGLGHTTRCIPLIRHLIAQGHRVTLAGNAVQQRLVQQACPAVRLTYLEGYRVGYGKNKFTLILSLLWQVPRLLQTVRTEHRWLRAFIHSQPIDGIISDNRYGFYHKSVPCVVMTHQLEIQTGLGAFANSLVRRLHYRLLGRFNTCWAVDTEAAPGLSGRLAHPRTKPERIDYLGLLSQTEQVVPDDGTGLLVLLSGPEPQRTILSQRLWREVLQHPGPVTFVEGAPPVRAAASVPDHIRYYGRLSAGELAPIIAGASLTICRSGYSTVMDLVRLRKKAILIPTPGQTEQEYLAESLHARGLFYQTDQSRFCLSTALADAATFPFRRFSEADVHHLFVPVLDRWVDGL